MGAVLVLLGFASSSPIPAGKDTTMTSGQSAGGMFVATGSSKTGLFKDAHVFCASPNQKIKVATTDESSALTAAGMPSAKGWFRCRYERNKEFARPGLRKKVYTVI
jgi:hypothetical protein